MASGARLELIAVEGLGEVRPGDDLALVIARALDEAGVALADGDVLVLAQKVVSKAEGRYVYLDTVVPSPRAVELAALTLKDPRFVELVLAEAREVLRAAPHVLVVEDRRGLVLANAGIDRSNLEPDPDGRERVLLLPADPDASAAALRVRFRTLSGARIGVIVADSLGRAWRLGTAGTAIGASGLVTLYDRRGEFDRYGRRLEITEVGLADELAAAASALMGQAAEGRPAVVIRGFQAPPGEGRAADLLRPHDKDLFR